MNERAASALTPLLRHCLVPSRLASASIVSKRHHASVPSNARLNAPLDYDNSPLLSRSPQVTSSNPELSQAARAATTKRMNYFEAVNDALRLSLEGDDRVVVFGEDIAFGGVFRCTMGLSKDFGSDRVFNTPLSEQGIVGFAIGAALQGLRPVAEIQFADYVFPAFDQLVNEAAKCRFREGATGFNCGGMVVRMPCGGVGHGAMYHSQSPESLFCHVPGLRVVMPRGPIQAKGMLLSAIACNDPVIFMEPKTLYRAAREQVPVGPFVLPLSKAEILRKGETMTIISYGTPLYRCLAAIEKAELDFGITVELIDLRTLYPWDKQTVLQSVKKTGRAIVVHESMVNFGIGAEVAATIQEHAFLRLEAPVQRVAGPSAHLGLVYEPYFIPDVARIYESIRKTIEY